MKCKNCKYFRVFKAGRNEEGIGRHGNCRRYPSHIGSQDINDTPYEEYWCGEFKRNTS